MPLYVYSCEVCNNKVEILQRYTDGPPLACLNCGAAESMSRNIAISNFQLKGDGWAKDGYSTKHSER